MSSGSEEEAISLVSPSRIRGNSAELGSSRLGVSWARAASAKEGLWAEKEKEKKEKREKEKAEDVDGAASRSY